MEIFARLFTMCENTEESYIVKKNLRIT